MRNQYSEAKLKPYIILDEKELVQIKKNTLHFNCNKNTRKVLSKNHGMSILLKLN